jgi:hypothetical protein
MLERSEDNTALLPTPLILSLSKDAGATAVQAPFDKPRMSGSVD